MVFIIGTTQRPQEPQPRRSYHRQHRHFHRPPEDLCRPKYSTLADIHGIDSMQSLFLGIEVITILLTDFVETGGKILDDDGAEISAAEALRPGTAPNAEPEDSDA